MADTAVIQAASRSPAKTKKAKKPKTSPSHPPTSQMVNNAVKVLKERDGSSLQAIKKYIAANYKVDAEKMSPFIRKYLKSAVASGALVQTKGTGASGSFRLASAGQQTAKKKSPVKKTKKASSSKPKKSVGAKKKSTKPKSPKAKKTKAGPTKKPKAPKPKTIKRKAAPKKK